MANVKVSALKVSREKSKSNRAGADEVALFPVGEQGAGFNLGKGVKLRLNDADRPIAVVRAFTGNV